MATTLPTYTGEKSSLVPLTGTPLTDALIVGSKWGTGPAGTGAILTFSFPASLEVFDTSDNVAGNYNAAEVTQSGFATYLKGFSAFSAEAQTGAREVLQSWANIANLSFTEVAADSTEAGVLRFANSAPPGMGATTYGVSSFPQDFAGAGDTWMNSAFSFPDGWAAGTQNFLTLLHEVGHALGLKHPHDAGMGGSPGWPANGVVLPFTGTDTLTTQSTQSMVMAYNDIPTLASVGGLSLQSDFAPTTPMRYDIAAMQYLYGPNTTYNAGDTTYTFDGIARYNQTLWDAGGNDTIAATGAREVIINLQSATWSQLGAPVTFSTRNADLSVASLQSQYTDPATVFIYDTVTIENAIGGDGNDVLGGNAVANKLQGGAGNDRMVGLEGIDTAIYSGARSDYTLSLVADAAGITTVTDNRSSGVSDGVDSLRTIERIKFTDTNVAIDLSGNAGQAAKLLGAVFGSTAVANKQFVGIALSLLDGGMSYQSLAAAAVGVTGKTSNTDVVALLWTNLFGAAPTTEQAAPVVAAMDGGLSVGALTVLVADSGILAERINLVGLIQTGIEFG